MKLNPLRKIRNFFHCLADVVRWTPLLWRDRDYDWAYLFYIMSFKLRRMANHYKVCGYHDNKEKDIKLLLRMAQLLDDISGDAHVAKLLDELREKWGEITLGLAPVDEYGCRAYVGPTFSKAITEEERAQARRELSDCSINGEKQQELALMEFCKLFQNNIRGLWC